MHEIVIINATWYEGRFIFGCWINICSYCTLDSVKMSSPLAYYKTCLLRRPIATKSITCSLLFVLGDYIAQKVEDGMGKRWDWHRSLNFAIVGATYYGPALHLWYCKILPKLANQFFKNRTKLFRVVGSVGFDQILFTPIFYCGYYITDSIVESRALVEGSKLGVRQIREKLLQTLIADLAVWPLATGINLWYVPIYYQVLYVNIVCLAWDVALCHITKQ